MFKISACRIQASANAAKNHAISKPLHDRQKASYDVKADLFSAGVVVEEDHTPGLLVEAPGGGEKTSKLRSEILNTMDFKAVVVGWIVKKD